VEGGGAGKKMDVWELLLFWFACIYKHIFYCVVFSCVDFTIAF
jgi:hypothetical protein